MSIQDELAGGVDQRQAVLAALTGVSAGEVNVPRSRRVRRLMYWRRCSRPSCFYHRVMKGWIFTGPTRASNPFEYEHLLEAKHAEPLGEEFGVEAYGDRDGYMTGGASGSRPTRFVRLLMHPQGMAQFPVDQIMAYGWHRVAELRKLLTPEQRAEVERREMDEVECPFGCLDPVQQDRRQRFLTLEDRDAHLSVFHPGAETARVTAAAIGEKLNEVTAAKADSDRIGEIVAAVMRAMQLMGMQGGVPLTEQETKYTAKAAQLYPESTEEEQQVLAKFSAAAKRRMQEE